MLMIPTFIVLPRKPEPVKSDICDNCGSEELHKVKGCVRCLKCGYKADCQGW